ncbi:glucose-6-phosphate dehydrogenase [Lentisphaerota bacterium WC36G]|nr:glucose-6-phosphate dehydrogenase [Lentisphaerae bacterium WC36]
MNKSNNWRGNLCVEMSAMPALIVIFGASGDLARRKLLVALFNLFKRKLLNSSSKIIGVARSKFSTEDYQNLIKEHLTVEYPLENCNTIQDFCSIILYHQGNYNEDITYLGLLKNIEQIESTSDYSLNRLFFMSLPSKVVSEVIPQLSKHQLTACVCDPSKKYCSEENLMRNVIIEKPFGHDLDSAIELDNLLKKYLDERQIYRIDHYLGKETVQNILMLRFANLIFEPIWNNQYIESVQITVAETLGVEERASYFDKSGILRDMFQNHILTILALIAMESPYELSADATRDEMLKLIKSIRYFTPETLKSDIIRAQYTANNAVTPHINGYLNEHNISENSTTETFVAMKLAIDNSRWFGVPFYLRSGKRLKEKCTEVVINFKSIKHSIFKPLRAKDLEQNSLVLRIQPHEGFGISLQAKEPGPKLCMGTLNMEFNYQDILEHKKSLPDAYERLLLDCLLGDQTLFVRSDIIEESWRLLMPILNYWQNSDKNNDTNIKNNGTISHSISEYSHQNKKINNNNKLFHYEALSWGPKEADLIIEENHTPWRNH